MILRRNCLNNHKDSLTDLSPCDSGLISCETKVTICANIQAEEMTKKAGNAPAHTGTGAKERAAGKIQTATEEIEITAVVIAEPTAAAVADVTEPTAAAYATSSAAALTDNKTKGVRALA